MQVARDTYTIRVIGHLDHHWSDWLGEFDMTHNPDGTTTITAPVVDQTQLHGVLASLRDIGAVITELSAPARQPQPALRCSTASCPALRRQRQPTPPPAGARRRPGV